MNRPVEVSLPHRNTKSFVVYVFGAQLVISYRTVVAAHFRGKAIRRKNVWGPTTGRHMREWGVAYFDEIEDPEEFDKQVREMLFEAASRELTKGIFE